MTSRDWSVIALVVALAIGIGLFQTEAPEPNEAYLPKVDTELGERSFSSSSTCRSCHPAEYASWHDSYHRTMTQYASSEAIVAPWDDESLSASGRNYRLYREGASYMVDMPRHGTTGARPEDRVQLAVAMTTGSHHMQYYWVPVPWAEIELDPVERESFQRSCGACHGADGEGVPLGRTPEDSSEELERSRDATILRAAGFDSYTLEQFWDREPHPEVVGSMSEEERLAAAAYLERVSFAGRLTQLPFVYFIRESRWVRDDHTFLQPTPSHDGLEPYGKHWSSNCDDCHSTGKRYFWDEESQLGQSQITELGIACEVCHGPAAEHVKRFQNPLERYRAGTAKASDGPTTDIVNPANLDPRRASSVCARCHSEAVSKEDELLEAFQPGERIEQRAHLLRLVEPPYPNWLAEILADEPDTFRDSFWPDGTIRVAGRDYNGLMVSRCFTEGELSCLSCHSMHDAEPDDQLSRVAQGDGACEGCHESIAANREDHTHHSTDSEGSRCYNCHMPHTTWGLMHAVRAHRIDSPSARVSRDTGRPNACNLCHIDRTLAQVAEDLTRWYGQSPVELSVDERTRAASVLWLLRGDAVQRALAAWHMSWGPALQAGGSDWQAPLLSELLDDPYAAVRFSASDSIGRLPGYRGFRYDFEGSRHDWVKATQSVRARFRALAASDANRPEVLLRRGFLDEAMIQVLLRQRDNTPISVAE